MKPTLTAIIACCTALPAFAGELPVIYYTFENGPPYNVRNLSSVADGPSWGALAAASPEVLAGLTAALETGDRAALAALLVQLDAELAERGLAAN